MSEEETFYSKLISKTWGQDAARHSVHEHQQLDDIMEELNEGDMASPGWLNRFKTLKHDYEHHMDEEEEDIFSQAKEVFDAEDANRFGERFASRKQEERKLVDEKADESLEE